MTSTLSIIILSIYFVLIYLIYFPIFVFLFSSYYKQSHVTTQPNAHNLQRATGARPVPPVQPHDCWLLNPYIVADRAAFGS